MKVCIFVIYHDHVSLEICHDKLSKFPWIKFMKIETTKYCESIFFEYLKSHPEEWQEFEFVGMITYSYKDKILLSTLEKMVLSINIGNFNDYDIIGLRGLHFSIDNQCGIRNHIISIMKMVPMPKVCLSDNTALEPFKSVFNKEQIQAGFNIEPHMLRILPFFSNYWVIRSKYLTGYLNWSSLVKQVIEKDPIIATENSHYKTKSKRFTHIFGVPYMTWHPFLMERMICIYTYFTNLRLYVYESSLPVRNDKKKFATILPSV